MYVTREEDIPNAVFRIRTASDGEIQGTCFLIQDQHLLTARHVVNKGNGPSDDLEVEIDQSWFPVRVRKEFRDQDVALLQFRKPLSFSPPFFELSSEVTANMSVRVCGFPFRFPDHFYHQGTVAGPMRHKLGVYQVAFTRAYPDHLGGLSGGPVLERDNGVVVGVFTSHSRTDPAFGEIATIQSIFDLIDTSSKIVEDGLFCVLILSEQEPHLDDVGFRLETAVKEAIDLVEADDRGPHRDIPVRVLSSTDIVSSRENLNAAIRLLCQARIAIFDVTNYEPVVMLLLGIRSVVRRGITLASVGGGYAIGDVIEFPFNIKEVSFVAHSKKQHDVYPPRDLIRERVLEGLMSADEPQYLDLPTFDVVRNLLPNNRRPIPIKEGILVLCSYGEKFTTTNWTILHDGLRFQLKLRKLNSSIFRVLDLASPKLLSKTIYEHIRRNELCIVDWSEWRPNVFFELGVRFAVSKSGTVCIIEDDQKAVIKIIAENPDISLEEIMDHVRPLVLTNHQLEQKQNEDLVREVAERYRLLAVQSMRLLDMFAHIEYHCSLGHREPYEEIFNYHSGAAGAKTSPGLPPDHIYRVVADAIEPEAEMASVPVYQELLQSARQFSSDDTEAISSLLYPERQDLRTDAENAVTERLLAAWAYLEKRYLLDEIRADTQLRTAYQEIGNLVAPRLLRSNNRELAMQIRKMVKELDDESYT